MGEGQTERKLSGQRTAGQGEERATSDGSQEDGLPKVRKVQAADNVSMGKIIIQKEIKKKNRFGFFYKRLLTLTD